MTWHSPKLLFGGPLHQVQAAATPPHISRGGVQGGDVQSHAQPERFQR